MKKIDLVLTKEPSLEFFSPPVEQKVLEKEERNKISVSWRQKKMLKKTFVKSQKGQKFQQGLNFILKDSQNKAKKAENNGCDGGGCVVFFVHLYFY
jgi:hypothetical protein